jgi:hypothetical protein
MWYESDISEERETVIIELARLVVVVVVLELDGS